MLDDLFRLYKYKYRQQQHYCRDIVLFLFSAFKHSYSAQKSHKLVFFAAKTDSLSLSLFLSFSRHDFIFIKYNTQISIMPNSHWLEIYILWIIAKRTLYIVMGMTTFNTQQNRNHWNISGLILRNKWNNVAFECECECEYQCEWKYYINRHTHIHSGRERERGRLTIASLWCWNPFLLYTHHFE